jgi:ketosteroid isomerase-like protein
MATEKVELVKRLIEAWNRNDWDELSDVLDPDVVGVPPEGWPEGGELVTDAEGLLRQFERLKDSWEEERVDVKEIREVDGDVVVEANWVTRGQGSGIELQVPISIRGTVEGGRITRAVFRVDDSAARPPGQG